MTVALCGFMGCGKTTVGKMLAEVLACPFADTDALIEQRTGLAIPEIFSRFGEEYFRDLELETVIALAQSPAPQVLSLGGGLILKQRAGEILKAFSKIIFLDVPLAIIVSRLEGDSSRPLLQSPNKAAVMAELFEKRIPFYKKAADIIINGSESPEIICNKIIKAF